MPHHKSCKKRMKTSREARLVNRSLRSELKTAVKKVQAAKDQDVARKALKTAASVIGKSAQSGLIHKNNAANRLSKLQKAVNKLAAA